jgi:hypothetical protein
VAEPEGVADDLSREAVTGVDGVPRRHPASLAVSSRSGQGSPS